MHKNQTPDTNTAGPRMKRFSESPRVSCPIQLTALWGPFLTLCFWVWEDALRLTSRTGGRVAAVPMRVLEFRQRVRMEYMQMLDTHRG